MEGEKMADKLKVKGINSAGFGIIQKSVMQNRELHGMAKCLYAYFCSFAGAGATCFPTRSKICYDLNISTDTFSKYLKNLVSCGYVEVEQIKENGKYSHNIYTLCDPSWPPRKTEKTVSENFRHGDTNIGNKENKNKTTNYWQEKTVSEDSVSEDSVSEDLDTKNNSIKSNSFKNNNINKVSKKGRDKSSQKVESNKKENLDFEKNQVSDSAINGQKISDSKKSKTFNQLIEEYTTNEELRKELKEHLKVRKLKKAALTDRAVELSLSELDKIAAGDYEKIQIVRNSIMNGWTGFFPLKKDEHDRLINSLAQHKPSYDIEAYKAMDVFGDWTPEDDAKMEEFNEDDTKKKYKFKSWDGVQ